VYNECMLKVSTVSFIFLFITHFSDGQTFDDVLGRIFREYKVEISESIVTVEGYNYNTTENAFRSMLGTFLCMNPDFSGFQVIINFTAAEKKVGRVERLPDGVVPYEADFSDEPVNYCDYLGRMVSEYPTFPLCGPGKRGIILNKQQYCVRANSQTRYNNRANTCDSNTNTQGSHLVCYGSEGEISYESSCTISGGGISCNSKSY
jgi:hypothetical protein